MIDFDHKISQISIMDSGEYKRISGAVTASLDLEGGTAELPRLAYKSRTQFYRVFRALIDETPGEMRRRLLLERAAWRLSRTPDRITDIAFDADYGSLEAFTRAFRKAFGVSPSIFRRMGETYHFLPAPNSIHFGAPAELKKGAPHMDLFDLFAAAKCYFIAMAEWFIPGNQRLCRSWSWPRTNR